MLPYQPFFFLTSQIHELQALPFVIYFFLAFPLYNTVSEVTIGILPLIAHHLCNLRDGMPRQWSPGVFLNPLPREVKGIHGGSKYPRKMPLFTYIAYMPRKEYQQAGSIYVLSPITEYYISFLLTLKQEINSYLCCLLFLIHQATELCDSQ